MPAAPNRTRLFASACLLLVLLGALSPGPSRRARAASEQLLSNPSLSEWADGRPSGWEAQGSATLRRDDDSYDATRSGPNASVALTAALPGDGLAQAGIAVQAGARYDVYAWVRAPGSSPGEGMRLRVTGEQTGTDYLAVDAFRAETPGAWHHLQATFGAGGDTTVRIAFVREGASGTPLEFQVDAVSIWRRAVDPTASLVAKPDRPRVLYGLEQNFERLGDSGTLSAFNVFDSYYQTPKFVTTLRSQGKVAAKRVYVPDVPVEDLVARWVEPFRDTMEGRLPQGFDAIVIDEFAGWNDSLTRSATVAAALQQTRELYPNRQIYVWGDWRLGSGATHDRILAAINQYADVFILEAYAHEQYPQYDLAGNLAANLARRAAANPATAGLLQKTVFGIAPYQSPDGFTADNSELIDFKAFLDEHFHRIFNDPRASATKGIGVFAYNYLPPDTMAWVNNLVRHYVADGQRGYLGPGRQGQSPFGRHASLLADYNPGFEVDGFGWIVSGDTQYARYEDLPEVEPFHGSSRSPVLHGEQLLATRKASAAVPSAHQVVGVQPSTTYLLSAYVYPVGPGAGVEVRAGDTRPGSDFQQTAQFLDLPGGTWTKVGVLFTTPADQRVLDIRVALLSAGVAYWDYVELTATTGVGLFAPVVTVGATSVAIDWLTDVPTRGEVRFGTDDVNGNAVASTTGTSVRHHVELTGLAPATSYRFRAVNRAEGAGARAFSSAEYAVFTRTAGPPVPDASPIPPDTMPPDPPTGLIAIAGSDGTTLDWGDEGYDIVGYNVYRSTEAAGPLERVNPALVRESTYVDASAAGGQRYYYAVTALDAAGNESAPSERRLGAFGQATIRIPLVASD